MTKSAILPRWPAYEVSDNGRVRNIETGHEIRPMPHHSGHLYWFPARRQRMYIHRAVLEAFVGLSPAGMECRHLDGNPANNELGNLAWGTVKENAEDKRLHERMPVGERSGTAKLTEPQVREIRGRRNEPSRALGREYGVSHTAILRAAKGITWGYLK